MKIKRGDVVIIAMVLMVTLVVYGVNIGNNLMTEDRSYVIVSVDGETVDTLDLSEDLIKVYDTEYGHNVLEIHNGKAYISEADCPDHVCMLTREAEMNGDAVICLPNHFALEISSGKGVLVDGVSQ